MSQPKFRGLLLANQIDSFVWAMCQTEFLLAALCHQLSTLPCGFCSHVVGHVNHTHLTRQCNSASGFDKWLATPNQGPMNLLFESQHKGWQNGNFCCQSRKCNKRSMKVAGTRAFQEGKMAMRHTSSHGVRFQGHEQSQQQEQAEKTMKSIQSLQTHCYFINCEVLLLQNHIFYCFLQFPGRKTNSSLVTVSSDFQEKTPMMTVHCQHCQSFDMPHFLTRSTITVQNLLVKENVDFHSKINFQSLNINSNIH